MPKLLPTEYDFRVVGNTTANDVVEYVVTALDEGPTFLGPDAGAVIALCTPLLILLCIVFWWQCLKTSSTGPTGPTGQGVCGWCGCCGCCGLCGHKAVGSRRPATGLQPDEEATDPEILGDDDDDDFEVDVDPKVASRQEAVPNSDLDDDEEEEEKKRASKRNGYNAACKKCCEDVAEVLENGGAAHAKNGVNGSKESKKSKQPKVALRVR